MSVRYLLDTNICIYIIKHNPEQVRQRFARHRAEELVMSVITLGELHHGAEKSQSRERSIQAIDHLLACIGLDDLDGPVADHYGDIRGTLERQGRIIGNNDLWLAAHARARGWVLVTNNEREFVRVEGLQVENWAR